MINIAIPLKITFGEWLRFKRGQTGLSQSKIAETVKVKTQTLYNWENGKSVPSLNPEQTRVLCKLLSVSLDTLAKAFRGEIEIDE